MISQRIREARRAKGLTLRQLAAQAGFAHHQTLDNIERGRQRASVAQIERLAAALGISAAWLAFGKEDDK